MESVSVCGEEGEECMWGGRGGVHVGRKGRSVWGERVGGRNSNTKQVNYLAYSIVSPSCSYDAGTQCWGGATNSLQQPGQLARIILTQS